MSTVATTCDPCAHEVFETRADLTPNAVALQHKNKQITYAELNSRANQLAHYLQDLGCGPESLVGIYLSRSLESIIVVLSILKAGGAYLFIEPASPLSRVVEIVGDAELSLIVTASEHRDQLPDLGVTILTLEEHKLQIISKSKSNPRSQATTDNAAYVTYTSGSTGKPVGVVCSHRSITHGLNWLPFDRGEDDICGLHSSLSFGMSVARLFLPLFSGVPLAVLPEEESKDAELLVSALEREKVTSTVLITPLFREILAVGPQLTRKLQNIRTLTIGGSLMTGDISHSLCELFPRTTVLEGYAASEVCGPAVVWVMSRDSGFMRPICRTFPNTSLYILDEKLEPVSLESMGELYVGAPHLARSYQRQPRLTAERFLPDPFSDRPGSRMFRTGDLGRQSSQGDIVVLGRTDDIVKIRGYRANVREIEAQIQTHDSVREVAVVAHTGDGDPKLVAYVVPEDHAVLKPEQLRKYLKDHLPEYMLPATFVFLERLPRTQTGKIDSRALAESVSDMRSLSEEYVAPRNSTEAALARIWSEVLEIDRVGIHDSFLELGGTSLSAIHINARIQQIFHLDSTLQCLLEHQTIANFCEAYLNHDYQRTSD